MNILIVNQNAGFYGGVEQNISDVASEMRGRGHTLSLIHYTNKGTGVRKFQEPFTAVELISSTDPTARQNTLRKLVSDWNIDLIYGHKIDSVSDLLSCRHLCKVVCMVHDHDPYCPRRHRYFTFSKKTCSKPMGLRCWLDLGFIRRDRTRKTGVSYQSIPKLKKEILRYNDLDQVITGSRYVRDQLLANGVESDSITVLPPVVKTSSREYVSPPQSRNLLYVGQLIRGKGVDLLIEAMRLLAPDVRLSIVGKGNAENDLQRLVEKMGLSTQVTFHGWVQPERLTAIYDASDVVAVPSRWPEPFGMVGLEAMRRGRPVVAFDVGGISDWLCHGRSGFLVPEQNTKLFAQAIKQLFDSPWLASRMGIEGRKIVESNFSFTEYINTLLHSFERDLEPNKGELHENRCKHTWNG